MNPRGVKGDGAPKSANLRFRDLSRDHGGHSRRANRGRLVGTGPCFSLPDKPVDQLAPSRTS